MPSIESEYNNLYVVTTPINLATLAAELTKKIGSLATIMWEHDEKKGFDRDDNYGAVSEKRPACQLLKYYSEQSKGELPSWCDTCDKYHYYLLKTKLNGGQMDEIPSFFSPGYINPELIPDELTGIKYIVYNCPVLGYKELIFPIVIDGVFLGVVFIGQILCKNDTISDEIFESFLSLNGKKIVRSLCKSKRERVASLLFTRRNPIESMKDMRVAEREGYMRYDKSLIKCLNQTFKHKNIDDFNELIRKSINGVQYLTNNLNKHMAEKREAYICSALNKIDISPVDPNLSKAQSVTDISSVFYRGLVKIFDTVSLFDIKSINVYGYKNNPTIKSPYMEHMLSVNKEKVNKYGALVFDSVSMPEYALPRHPWQPILSVYLNDGITTQVVENIFFHNKFSKGGNQKNIAYATENCLFLLYEDWLVFFDVEKSVNDNLHVYVPLLKEMSTLFTAYLGRYELCLSKFVSNKYELTLRLYRHECRNIAEVIDKCSSERLKPFVEKIKNLREDVMSKDEDFAKLLREVQYKNLENACLDLEANTNIISHMGTTIAILSGLVNREHLDKLEKRSRFRIGFDLIMKWKVYHAYTCQEQHKDILISNSNRDMFESKNFVIAREERFVYHRKRLIDHVVSNIINNAMKYSQWGTNVRVTVGEDYTSKSSVIPLIIENYGRMIDKMPKAFDLYYRRPENITHIDGDGLGLYIAKCISDMLELDIHYTCEFISDYNIGIAKEYIERGENDNIKTSLIQELEEKKYKVNKFINPSSISIISEYPVSSEDLEEKIRDGTYHITFRLQIQTSSLI